MKRFVWAIAVALLLGLVMGIIVSGGDHVTAAPNVVNTFNTRSGNVTLTSSDVTDALTFTPVNLADLTATNTNLANNYFTKSASDSRFALLGSSYTKTESDARYAASGQVITSLNNLTGGVTLAAGSNVTITPSGNTLTIGASSSSSQPPINPLRVATLQWYERNRTGAGVSLSQAARYLVFDGSSMWTTTGFSLVKFRPSDGAILGTFSTITGGSAGALTFDGANIWVAILDDPLLLKFRASDGALLGMFFVDYQSKLAFDGEHVWASSNTKLVKLRPSDASIVDQVELGSQVLGLAVDDKGWIWATLRNDTVVRVHASDSEIVGPYTVGVMPQGIAFDGANMWVANSGSLFVTKLRASDGAVLGSFNGANTIEGNPLQPAFDGTHMWVTTSAGYIRKFRISDGAQVGGFFTGTNPGNIAFDGVNVWFAHSGGVTKF
jgi:hypothetical protein